MTSLAVLHVDVHDAAVRDVVRDQLAADLRLELALQEAIQRPRAPSVRSHILGLRPSRRITE